MSDPAAKLTIQEFLSDEHLKGIGLVIGTWSYAEGIIRHSLWEVATGHSFAELDREKGVSLALITGMDVRVALGILKAVFRAKFPQSADQLDKLADRLNKLYDRRNTIAHGIWRKGQKPNSIACYKFKTSGELGSKRVSYTSEELRRAACLIQERAQQLLTFLQKYGYSKDVTAAPGRR